MLAAPRFRPALAALGREVGPRGCGRGVSGLEAFNGFDRHAFSPGRPDAALERSFDDMVAFNRRSAKSHSGIWRDLAVRKRRTEVDAQIGADRGDGAAHGIEVPAAPESSS